MNYSDLQRTFASLFGDRDHLSAPIVVQAPGRVNLIGEHVDYCDGFVLPLAIPFHTTIIGAITATSSTTAATSTKTTARIVSGNIDKEEDKRIEFMIDGSLAKGDPKWGNYVKGVIAQYVDEELPPNCAFDAFLVSNVPMGSGLSSSASLEVCVATLLEELFDIRSVSKVQKALRCQKAEHVFADTPCGIMDQYISALGVEGKLLLIDCRSKEATPVSIGGDGAKSVAMLVINSKVKHELSGSEYPDRVRQCREAVHALHERFPTIHSLRDTTWIDLQSMQSSLDPLIFARAAHVVTENDRTLAAVQALERGDFVTVGKLMSASHESLKTNFEVSCSELDLLQRLACECEGVYGSRMTGGGFGGCTISLVDKAAIPQIISFVQSEYKKATGIDCDCFVVEPSAGAGVVKNDTNSFL